MKKLILSFCALMSATFMSAQSDCMSFFPDSEGTVLISKSYDANNVLLNTITYKVEKSYPALDSEMLSIACDITDANGEIIDKGEINASCVDGSFYLKMKSEAVAPELFDVLGRNTQLVGNFLDYPNTFSDDIFDNSTFEMGPGEYTVESKADKKDRLTVRVYDRQYEKNEKITTPAGTFHASKISFMFESEKGKGNVETHKGVEWYAVDAGIVRSETYDKHGKLESYTVLTTLDKK